MKRIFLPIITLLLGIVVSAQVGVNTSSPAATFDITAKNATGNLTARDGLLIPRIDRQRAQTMTGVQSSTLVYINNIATGSATGQASNIGSVGFYYFDGAVSKWTKLNVGTDADDPTKDAFEDDAVNTMVKLGTTSAGAVRAAGTDFVIMDTGNVGIGITNPAEKLDVNGNVRFRTVPTAATLAATDQIMVLDNTGEGKKISVANIADTTPDAFVNDSSVGNTMVKLGTTSAGAARAAGTDFVIKDAGNVGIGITNPAEKLDVSGNVRFRTVPEAAALAATDQVMVLASDGTAKKVAVAALQRDDIFNFYQSYEKVATANVDRSVSGTWTSGQAINNVNLGISIPVIIPANTTAKLIVNYSVPMGNAGLDSCLDSKLGYYGIRFLKNNTEEQMGSRKSSFSAAAAGAKMTTVSGIFIEEVANNTASPLTITYALNGYLEFNATTISSPCEVRFNMWSASGANFNWGKGAMTVQMLIKPL